MSENRNYAAHTGRFHRPAGLSVEAARAGQNPALAVPAGLIAAIFGAMLWATSVYLLHIKLSIAAVAIGYVVGHAIKIVGQGIDQVFGVLGAACAGFGWALGTLMCNIAFIAKEDHAPVAAVLQELGPNELLFAALRNASVLDIIFLGIAVWEGYRFAFRYNKKA